MYYDLVTLLLLAYRGDVRSLASDKSLILGLFLLQDGSDSGSNGPGLQPSAIRERRVIRGGRRKMPLLVCGIKALPVPALFVKPRD